MGRKHDIRLRSIQMDDNCSGARLIYHVYVPIEDHTIKNLRENSRRALIRRVMRDMKKETSSVR